MGGGYKKEIIEKLIRELKLQNMNIRTLRRLNPKDEPFTSKIEQVNGVLVSQVVAKSQFCQYFKFQNLIQFLRFRPNFLHVSSISIEGNL